MLPPTLASRKAMICVDLLDRWPDRHQKSPSATGEGAIVVEWQCCKLPIRPGTASRPFCLAVSRYYYTTCASFPQGASRCQPYILHSPAQGSRHRAKCFGELLLLSDLHVPACPCGETLSPCSRHVHHGPVLSGPPASDGRQQHCPRHCRATDGPGHSGRPPPAARADRIF